MNVLLLVNRFGEVLPVYPPLSQRRAEELFAEGWEPYRMVVA